MTYRINGFEQIKAFYSWVFNNAQERVTPQHISMYLFLVNQNNRNNWVEWFKCPLDLGMAGACIGNKKTYYKCLAELSDWGFIEYERGINEYKAPLIKLEVLKSTTADTATVPQSKPLPIPQHTPLPIPLPIPLPTHIYKLVTDNLKPITDNYKEVESFIKGLSNKEKRKRFTAPTLDEVINYFNENGYTKEVATKAWNYYEAGNWKDSKGTAVKAWKQKMQGVWFKDENKQAGQNQAKFVY